MKRYRIYGLIALVALLATSCAIHDPFADNGQLGQVLPTVDWEQGSTVVKAGRYATFKGKYYTTAEKAIDHSEVWCLIKREQTATATSKLTTSLAYTKNYSLTDTVRSSQMVATYPHSKAEWDGYEYVLTDSFPTSRTLAPVAWVNPEEWDQEKFDSYYPSGFQQEFMDHMVNALTKDSTYYNDLRNVYIKYNFPIELFEQLNAQYNRPERRSGRCQRAAGLQVGLLALLALQRRHGWQDHHGAPPVHALFQEHARDDSLHVVDLQHVGQGVHGEL